MNDDLLSALYEADDVLDGLRRKHAAELSWVALREIERAQAALGAAASRVLLGSSLPKVAS